MSEMKERDRRVALQKVLSFLAGVDYDNTPTAIALRVHDLVTGVGGLEDPYSHLKKESNNAALSNRDELRKRVKGAEDPLYEAILLATCGNVMDYGAKNLFDLEETMDGSKIKGFRLDDYEEFKKKEMDAKNIYYIADNSGEIVLDMLLIEELLERKEDRVVQIIVKRSPILNDITEEDAHELGLDDMDGVRVIKVPEHGWLTVDQLFDLERSDLIISKGQGNFEGLSDVDSIFFLLVCKCEVVGEFLGVDVGDLIFKYSGPGSDKGDSKD